MEIKVLIDTNILLDYILTREPFYNNAKKIMLACTNGKIKACIAAHSISNMFFVLRKEYEPKERRKLLLNICKIFDIQEINKEKLVSGLKNNDFSDFEDCLQMECARTYGAGYIITRNVIDYKNSMIQAILPEDFLKIIES